MRQHCILEAIHEIINKMKRLIPNGKAGAAYVKECCETVEIVLHRLDAFSRRSINNGIFASIMYSSHTTTYCTHVCFLLRFWGIKSWQQLWLAWESCWEASYCVLLLCLINPTTIHCSIILWVNFGDVFSVSNFEERLLYCHLDCSVLQICLML